ncbi:MAG TPA: FHA domain-containing protein, partial [Mycobacterium sp.]|nr:FHA domain-containing protein [Mycobacterium sp.]
MSRPAPPLLTIWHNGSERTFAPGHDVVVGRDLRADIRIADPRISRAHLILRFEQGKWMAIDNGSVNGTFVNGYRSPVVDIHDGQSINIGNAGGPRLTFEVGPRRGKGGRPPGSASQPATESSTVSWSTPAPPGPAPAQPPGQIGGPRRGAAKP